MRKRKRYDYESKAKYMKGSGKTEMKYPYYPKPKWEEEMYPKEFVPGRDRRVGTYGRFTGSDVELKYVDTVIAAAAISAAGNILNLGTICVVPQGAGPNERIGRKITVKMVQYRCNLTLNAVTGSANPRQPETVRIIVYEDKQCNGVAATVLNILTTATYDSFRNLTESNRFRILLDSTEDLNYASAGVLAGPVWGANGYTKSVANYMKCAVPIEYSNDFTTGVISTIRSNNIGVMLIAAAGICVANHSFRIRYTDM